MPASSLARPIIITLVMVITITQSSCKSNKIVAFEKTTEKVNLTQTNDTIIDTIRIHNTIRYDTLNRIITQEYFITSKHTDNISTSAKDLTDSVYKTRKGGKQQQQTKYKLQYTSVIIIIFLLLFSVFYTVYAFKKRQS